MTILVGSTTRRTAGRHWPRTSARSIVLVDPDLDTSSPILSELAAGGLEVTLHGDVLHALVHIAEHRPDAVVLSVTTPIGDAVRLVTLLRSEFAMPVLVALRTEAVDDAAPIIAAGGRPVVDLPYRLDTLLDAVRELPARKSDLSVLHVGALTLEPTSMELVLGGQRVHVAPREFSLLLALAERADEVVATEELRRAGWPGLSVSDATLMTTVARLRQRLAEAGAGHPIQTIRGVGYRMSSPALSDLPPHSRPAP
ncbi:winged helix-turn-helix domain-containing protein [Georgenia sp. Z1344]|uniref:winged helix-turn-helix domain-containing protein n=1 Tax=Georgenia sp. Z1344 TaxID=3416706 RepID=UPI003CF68CE4